MVQRPLRAGDELYSLSDSLASAVRETDAGAAQDTKWDLLKPMNIQTS